MEFFKTQIELLTTIGKHLGDDELCSPGFRQIRDHYVFLKPLDRRDDYTFLCPAMERIAYRLAAFLGIMVPPVQILHQTYPSSVSYYLAKESEILKTSIKEGLFTNPESAEVLKDLCLFSTICVFDVWLAENDRHTGNVVFYSKIGWASIDYSQSMLFHEDWRRGVNHEMKVSLSEVMVDLFNRLTEEQRELALCRVVDLDPQWIEEAVYQVPDYCLSPSNNANEAMNLKRLAYNGLIWRKQHLRRLCIKHGLQLREKTY